MHAEDAVKLKALIESALAESVKEFGGGVSPTGEWKIVVPHDQLWAFVNVSDVRAILTDRAVKVIGGKDLVVTVDDDGVVIERSVRVEVKGNASVVLAPTMPE